ncbi:MAG: ROK family protein, partial [Chloroflexota bacterium]
MSKQLNLIKPNILPPLDEGFRPAVLANRNFRIDVESVGERLVIGLERSSDDFSRFETMVFPEN